MDHLPDFDLAAGMFQLDAAGEQSRRPPRMTKSRTRRAKFRQRGEKKLAELFCRLPEPDETHHYLTHGFSDSAAWLFRAMELLEADGHTPTDVLLVTRTIGRTSILELQERIDRHAPDARVALVLNTYYPQVHRDVWPTVHTIVQREGWALRFTNSHAKIHILRAPQRQITITTSANLNRNDLTEQLEITGAPEPAELYGQWIDELVQRLKPPEAPAYSMNDWTKRYGVPWPILFHTDERPAAKIIQKARAGGPSNPKTLTIARKLGKAYRDAHVVPPSRPVVTCPPQGTSAPGYYLAADIAAHVAPTLHLAFRRLFDGCGRPLEKLPEALIIVDDSLHTGATLARLARHIPETTHVTPLVFYAP